MDRPGERVHPGRLLLPVGYYGASSIYQGYISLYYTQLGFGSAQLGLISAATAAASLAAQPVWGMQGDRAQSQRRLLGRLCLAAVASLPLALLGKGFAWQLLSAVVFYAFFCALLPLGDAILLESGERFGVYRLAGGLSFALVSFLFGMVRGKLAPGGVIWAAAGMLLLVFFASRCLPDAAGRQREGRRLAFDLLRDRKLTAMLLFVLPLQMTMGVFHTFYAPYFKALGGSDFLLGLGYLLSAVGEIPYLLLSRRIYRRFGAARPMCAAALLLAARWALLGCVDSAWAALLSQLLHGGGFIVITVSMAYWIAEHVPRELRAGGQALLNMVTFGLARVAGNLLGGWLAGSMGYKAAFGVSAGLCLAAVLAFFPWVMGRKGE